MSVDEKQDQERKAAPDMRESVEDAERKPSPMTDPKRAAERLGISIEFYQVDRSQ